jgi:hypothetical protein
MLGGLFRENIRKTTMASAMIIQEQMTCPSGKHTTRKPTQWKMLNASEQIPGKCITNGTVRVQLR